MSLKTQCLVLSLQGQGAEGGWEGDGEARKKKETYLQLTVTFTVLVSGEAMSFKALHS